MDEAPVNNPDVVDEKSAGSPNTTPSLQKICRKGDKIYHAHDENVTMMKDDDDQSRQSNDLSDVQVDPISSGESLYKTFTFDADISKEETDKCIMFWRSVVEKNLEPIKCTIIEDLNKSKRNDAEKKDKDKAKKKTKTSERSSKEIPKSGRKGVWSNILEELQKTRLHKTKLLLEKRCRICEYTTGSPYETDNEKDIQTHLKELDGWQPKSNKNTRYSGLKPSNRTSTDKSGSKRNSSGLKNQRQQSSRTGSDVQESIHEILEEGSVEEENDSLLTGVKEASNKIEYIDAIEKKKREQIYSKWRQNKVELTCECLGLECDCNTNPAVVGFDNSRYCTEEEIVKECDKNNQSQVSDVVGQITSLVTNKQEDTDGSKQAHAGETVKEYDENTQSLVSKDSEDNQIIISATNKQKDTDGSKRTPEATILEVQKIVLNSAVEIIELDTNDVASNEDPNIENIDAGSYKLELDDVDQYISNKSVDMLATSGDISSTWTSPMYPKLYSNDTNVNPLGRPITQDEDSWIGSLINVGAIVGSIPAGLIADKLGRKITLLCLAVPHFTAYVMYAFATKVYHLYIARFINGISLGAGYALLPMYVAEITEDFNRNSLSASLNIFWTFGNFIPYAIGPYLPYKIFNFILAGIPLTFFIFFLFIGSESPYYLVSNGKIDKAEKTIIQLRQCNKDTAAKEILKIQDILGRHENGTLLDIFTNKGLRKALIISLVLIALQQTSGINAVSYYLQPIFEASGANISADISSTICGACMFIFSFSTILVVERAGKRIPLAIATFGDFLSLIALGIFFYIHDKTSMQTDQIFWLPIVAVISYLFFFNFAFATVPWTVSSELFPNNVKAISASAVACCSWSFSFIVTRFFNLLNDNVGRAGTFWIYAGGCLATFIFDLIWIPETKEKSLIEIQDMLQKKR